jgi:hypothetical protein
VKNSALAIFHRARLQGRGGLKKIKDKNKDFKNEEIINTWIYNSVFLLAGIFAGSE